MPSSFFAPKPPSGVRHGGAWTTACFARFALAWPRLALDKDKD